MKRKKWIILFIFFGISVIGIAVKFMPKTITEEKAIHISKSILTDQEINTITNYDTPQIEVIVFEDEPFIYKSKSLNMANMKIYAITYSTSFDPILGPIVIYIDSKTGVIYGRKYRL